MGTRTGGHSGQFGRTRAATWSVRSRWVHIGRGRAGVASGTTSDLDPGLSVTLQRAPRARPNRDGSAAPAVELRPSATMAVEERTGPILLLSVQDARAFVPCLMRAATDRIRQELLQRHVQQGSTALSRYVPGPLFGTRRRSCELNLNAATQLDPASALVSFRQRAEHGKRRHGRTLHDATPSEAPPGRACDVRHMLQRSSESSVDALRSKTPVATVNEVLLKISCHNIVCLVHAVHELGITLMLGCPQKVAAALETPRTRPLWAKRLRPAVVSRFPPSSPAPPETA